jgi:cytochrome c
MFRAVMGAFALILVAGAPPARAQDAAAGERVFKTQCGGCHSPVKGQDRATGPSVFGILADGGAFESKEMLDRYLISPRSVIRRTTMSYPGLKNEQQRKDLIAYLETLK